MADDSRPGPPGTPALLLLLYALVLVWAVLQWLI
jgi:hypothetical protein